MNRHNPTAIWVRRLTASWNLATQGGTVIAPTDPTPAGPPMDASYFLNIPGLPGDSTAVGHLGTIDVDSMSWGVSAGATSFAPLVIESPTTAVSPLLFLAVAEATFYPTITLTAARNVNGGLQTYAQWTLENVVITKYVTADNEDQYDISFTGVDVQFIPTSSTGQQGTPVDASFSFKANAQITLSSLSQVYDGLALFATAATNPPDLDVVLAYSQNGQPINSPTNAGTYQVVATIVDPSFQGTALGALVISPAATAISLTSSANPSVPGQYVSYTATIQVIAPGAGTPNGSVSFRDGSSLLAIVPLSGNQATFSAAVGVVGKHAITASFSPTGANYLPPLSPASLAEQVQPVAIVSDTATGHIFLRSEVRHTTM